MSAFGGKADIAAKLITRDEARRIAASASAEFLEARPPALEVFIIRRDRRRDVLEYCPSGLGDTHEATAVHDVFRRDARRQYTVVVASRARATAGNAVGRATKPREA